MKKYLLFFSFVTIASIGARSQSILDSKLRDPIEGRSLVSVLEEIEKQKSVKFYFLPQWIEGISLQSFHSGQTLRYVLDEVFLGTSIKYLEINSGTIVFLNDPEDAIRRDKLISEAIHENKDLEEVKLGNQKNLVRNQMLTIKGEVRDSKKKEVLSGASIQVKDLALGVSTDASGKFQVIIPAGEHILSCSFLNFQERTILLTAYDNGELNILLEEAPIVLSEVVVQDQMGRESVTSNSGQIQISIKEIKRAPSLLGEADLIKQIQVLPGVTTAGEAASGYNVRGGSVDQNLILYDGMPVFNSSHVFGFFSAFNAEAIRDVSFYRGGIPAEFGGRVSSVLDIRSKEGDYEKWTGGAGIGMITSNVNFRGPIIKNKTTIAASARSTYSDWVINSIRSNYVDLSKSTLTFYDATLKIAHKFSNKTKLTFSGYTSQDQFRIKGDSLYRWHNLLGSLRIDHFFSTQLTSSFVIGYGSYGYEVENRDNATGFNLSYRITYPSAKLDFHYHLGNHKLIAGSQATYYGFEPGTLKPNSSQSSAKPQEMEKQKSLESAVYVSDNFAISEKLNLEAGLRASMFQAIGPGTVNLYKPNLPIVTTNFDKSISYKSGETIKVYHGLEPRASIRYSLTSNSSVKAGYNRIYQYLQLVTNTTAVTPIDIWQPSGYYFKPQVADQFSLGYFRNFKENTYDAFVEVYYKEINNILDFKDGARLILNDHLETDLLQGKGKAYGVETQLTKSSGRLTGSLSYTYSRSLRTIAGPTLNESINSGKTYPSNFDQPHSINLTWKYNLSRRYFFTGGFTYRTGRPITFPVSKFEIDNISVANFSERNQYRIPDYHRLDIAFVLEGSHKRKKFFDGTWVLSFYNVYGRQNPYTIFFKEVDNSALLAYRLSVIGTILPSLSYNVKF
ncbi:MAG: TonB-dependent receptor [Bacteroidetes bacterium]|nr:TonB-dependent receptor [Bacteroidota bacterium]